MPSGGEKVKCPHCSKEFKPLGLGIHQKSCKKKHENAAQEEQFRAELRTRPQKSGFRTLQVGIHLITAILGSLPAPKFAAPWETDTRTHQSLVDDSDVFVSAC